jgi:hypothetical protein
MKKFRTGNITIEIDDQNMFATIHRHGKHDRVVGSLSIELIHLPDLAQVAANARAEVKR